MDLLNANLTALNSLASKISPRDKAMGKDGAPILEQDNGVNNNKTLISGDNSVSSLKCAVSQVHQVRHNLSDPMITSDNRNDADDVMDAALRSKLQSLEESHDSNEESVPNGKMIHTSSSPGVIPNGSISLADNNNDIELDTPEQPDQDTIKMFVGQVPRSMDESELKVMFEEFGPVFQINVLRDKVTGQSKGCCFVTFFKRKCALEAQNCLHNIKTLPGMHHPIQMKPADTENRNERKLFVGMVSKKFNENDVRVMFNHYGTIEECTVLRDANGISKGCAFVTFSSRQNAITAIKAMHHSQTMEGCSSPIVVKFADTQKEKEQKKVQQLQTNLWTLSGAGIAAPPVTGIPNIIPQQYMALQALQMQALNGASPLTGSSIHQPTHSHLSALNAANGLQNNYNLALQQLLSAGAQQQQHQQQQNAQSTLTNGIPSGPVTHANLSNLTSIYHPHTAATATGLPVSNGSSALLHHQTLSSNNSNTGNMTAVTGANTTNELAFQSLAGLSAAMQNGPQQAMNPFGMANLSSLAALSSNNPAAAAAALQAMYQSQGLNGSIPTTQNSCLGNVSLLSPTNALVAAGARPASLSSATTPTASSQIQISTGIPTVFSSPLTNPSTPVVSCTGTPGTAPSPPALGALAGLKQHEGPDGANLFIYHLPQEYSDSDLLQTFNPFGNVVSAKVFIDKQTNLSKCFGFVSYDNPVSALAAIQAMNGFQVGTKRLKVQLKRSRDASKPY